MKKELKKQIEYFSHIINNYPLSDFIRDNDYFEDEKINHLFKGILKGYEYTNTTIFDVDKLYELCNEELTKKVITNLINYKPTTDRELLKHQTFKYFKEKEFEIDEKLYKENVIPDELEKTPYLYSNSFKNLPKNINDILDRYTDNRKKDIMFLGLLTYSSILFDNFYFRNTYQNTYPNLYTFIGAQAGSGKGVAIDAKHILHEYLKKEREDNEILEAQSIVDSEYTDKDGKLKYKKITPPKFKRTDISANTSTAKLYELINNNRNNTAILFTSEVGELSSNNKTDWGGYDIILRECFHNESISTSRVTGVNVYIEHPYLSVLATGTMDQFVDMFAQKTTNGLFSRCLFYTYKTDLFDFNDDYNRYEEEDLLSISEFIKQKSKIYYDMFRYFSLFKKIEVDIQREDYKTFINYFSNLNRENLQNYDDDISATNRRFASIAKRILIIITAIRYFEEHTDEIDDTLNNSFNTMFNDNYDYMKIYATKKDIEFVIEIMDKLIKHTLLLYSTLDYNIQKKEVIIKVNNNDLVYNQMEDIFSIKYMKEYALEKYNITNKTIERFVSRCVNAKRLKPVRRGYYKKIK